MRFVYRQRPKENHEDAQLAAEAVLTAHFLKKFLATSINGTLGAASLVPGIKAPSFDRDAMIFTLLTPDDYVAPSDWVEITGG